MCVCEPHAVGTLAMCTGAVGFVTSKTRRPSKPGANLGPGVGSWWGGSIVIGVSCAVAQAAEVTGRSIDWIRRSRFRAL